METRDGYLITPNDPAVVEQLEAGREFRGQHEDAFKA
jgi:hypothetical protein